MRMTDLGSRLAFWALTLVGTLVPITATAQDLYGVGFLGGHVEVFKVNSSSGAMTPFIATSATSLAGGISTFDSLGKRLFFMSDPDLYVVNVVTGAVSHVSLGGSFPLLQFDSTTNTLYAIGFLAGQVEVFAVDPATGVKSPMFATGATTFLGGISTFDPIGKRLFFMSDPDLYVVNVSNGAVSHVSLGGSFPLLQFDLQLRRLYGVGFSAGQVEVFSIDPSTGAMTPLVATGATTLAGGIVTFDPLTERLFFMSDPDLYVVNLATAFVSHVSLGGAFPLLQFDAPAVPLDLFSSTVAMALLCILALIGLRAR